MLHLDRGSTGFRLSLAAFVCLLSVRVAMAQDVTTVFEALKALYEATDGDNWTFNTNWDTTMVPTTAAELNTWFGVYYSSGALTALNLPDNNLRGNVPPELGNLTKLRGFRLQNNSLTGTIPTELGNLTELRDLWLNYNSLTGTVPPELGNLAELRELRLYNNSLTGAIPTELGNLTELRELLLYNNSLTGTVPTELGNLTKLRSLWLITNRLVGQLPETLTQLSDLTTFHWAHNDGLCAPSTTAFQMWLSTLSYTRNGPMCLGLPSIEDQLYYVDAEIADLLLPAAVGGTSPFEYELSPDEPAGLGFHASSRTLSGTPTAVMVQTEYTYTVTDSVGTAASQTFTIEVKAALALDAVADQAYVVGEAIPDLVLPAAVGGTDPYTYMLSPDPPAGLVYDALTRTLSGTPTAVTAPTVYTYTAEDAASLTASQTFNIEVVAAVLRLPSVADQAYVMGKVIPDLVLPAAVGGTDPYTYMLSPDPPAGLVYDALTRTLSGTPTAAVAPTVYTYTAEDAASLTASQTFRIEVLAEALTLPAIANQVYVVGEPITPLALPAAMGGRGPYVYAFGPDLPVGLVYDARTRTLSGTPTAEAAPTVYTYTAEDAASLTASQTFNVEVVAAVLRLPSVADQVYVVGEAVPDLVLPAARGGTDPYTYTLSPDSPAGLVYDTPARTLSGTPTAAIAPTVYTYTATDAAGETVWQEFTIEVKLALAAIADQFYVLGEAIPDLVLPAAVGGTDPYTYMLSPDPPAGLVYDALTRTLSGTPTAVTAPTAYTYTAEDAASLTTSQTFNVEVVAAVLRLPSVADQVYVVGEAVPDLVLPAARGGTDPYMYTLSPDSPAGLVYDAPARTLSGTPTAAIAPTVYTYTATDAAGETVWQEFTIEVKLALAAIADQFYVLGEAIPDLVLPAAVGGTDPHTYTLSPDLPAGLEFDAPTRTLNGLPTAAIAPTVYTYTVTDAASLTTSQTFYIEVLAEALTLPAIAGQIYVVGEAITPLALPAAMGGRGPYVYAFGPDLPVGLVYDASTRTLSGTPTAEAAPTEYTYTVTDATTRTASQTCTIVVVQEVLTLPAIADQEYVMGERIPDLVLPAAMGGRSPYAYMVHPEPPAGLVYDAEARTLIGTPTAAMDSTVYTYSVEDATASTASQTFHIEVLASLTLPAIADQIYPVGEAITPLALPAAMGGRGPYVYTLSPDPLAGLLFDAQARTLSGTPTEVSARAAYTYTVADAATRTASQAFHIVVEASAALVRDRAVLIALYDATDGAHWTDHTNWLHPPADVLTFTEEELNAWFGITVSEGRVVGLELPHNNLRGTLPEALGNLSDLAQLRLYGNSLEGGIPSSLGQLDSLRGLLLHDNALTGAIPPELGNLPSLEQLHLHNNGLDGGIPAALGALAALKQLWLYGNSLGGSIPRALGQLDSLRGLLLQDNALIGAIPPELGDLAHLEDLWLQGNSLEGAIPPALGQLDSLRGLLLHENQLTGAIPPELGGLGHLQDLWLHGNALEDSIPRALGQLDSLRGLLLHGNQLTGTIPSSLGDLAHLQWLQLQENALAGTIPPALGRLTHLERLQLSDNVLTGLLPDSLGQLVALAYLYVDDNALSGALPATLVQLAALKELFFGGPDQDVCAPLDAAFRAWLGSLEAVRGPDCGGTTVLTFAEPVSDQRYMVGQGIAGLALPPVQGGSAPYRYTLQPALPAGLVYDAQTRTLRGVPSDAVSRAVYTYTAVDESGSTGRLTFAITVVPSLAELLQLHGNYPNPFRETTHLDLSLQRDARVSVEVFDLLGRSVLRQEEHPVEAGPHRRLAIDGMEAVPGVYLYRIVAVMDRQTLVRTGRMIRLR